MANTLGPHLSYYWTLWQSEWATDLIINTPAELTGTMASLLRHAWITCVLTSPKRSTTG